MKFKSETEASTELIESVWSYIELQGGEDLSVEGYIKHLKDSYTEGE